MDIDVVMGNILEQSADAIVLNLFEGVEQPGGATGSADTAMNGAIRQRIVDGDFQGKFKQVLVLYPDEGIVAKRILLVGLGKEEDLTLDRIRQVSAVASREASEIGVRYLATLVHGAGVGGIEPGASTQAIVEGAILGTYRFSEYKTTNSDDGNDLTRITIVEFDGSKQSEVERGTQVGGIVAEGVCLARDLGSHPGNEMTPRVLADRAQAMAREVGLTFDVLDEAKMADEGMRTILSVSEGSDEPARFIVFEHEGGRGDEPPVVLVGKGITFDTGGISIKGSEGMWDMKFDMGGACAVVGAMQAVARLNLPLHVVGLVAASENMPSGRALKPGDIIRSMLGKTIEIRSTDAEGRLVLADAVTYSARYKPAAVVDLATLTGACVTALGHEASGLFSNDDNLAKELSAAGERSGEIAWRLPILEGHRDLIKSDIADIKNTGGRPGGAITGAAFIEHFAQDLAWAHLDIAGTAWSDKDRAYTPKGGTGVGVRLLIEFLRGRT